MLMQQLLNGIVVGSVYSIFALGFTLLFGVNNILNMAHGSVFTWGAFAGLAAVTLGAPFPLALLIGMVAGGLLSVLLDLVAFRPLRRRKSAEVSALLSSLGANIVLLSLAQQVSQTRVMRYPFGTFPIVNFQIFGLRIQLLQATILVICVLIVIGLGIVLYRTGFGRRVRSVAFSPVTSRLLGINSEVVNAQVFFISGALAGLAGVLIGIAFNSVHYVMGEPFLMKAFVIIILGGLGSIPGALIAGLLIGVIEALAFAYVSSSAADGITFAILFLIILIRPTGLFGKASSTMRVQRQ